MSKATKKPSKKVAASARKGGLRGIEDYDPKVAVIKETASVIPFLIKTGVVCGIIYMAFRSYKNRFKKKDENNNYPAANITMAEAESRADIIDSSVGAFSGDFDAIANALGRANSAERLNYNAYVRIYNAFGNRKATYLGSEMNLIEWLRYHLSDYQFSQIRTLTSGQIG